MNWFATWLMLVVLLFSAIGVALASMTLVFCIVAEHSPVLQRVLVGGAAMVLSGLLVRQSGRLLQCLDNGR